MIISYHDSCLPSALHQSVPFFFFSRRWWASSGLGNVFPSAKPQDLSERGDCSKSVVKRLSENWLILVSVQFWKITIQTSWFCTCRVGLIYGFPCLHFISTSFAQAILLDRVQILNDSGSAWAVSDLGMSGPSPPAHKGEMRYNSLNLYRRRGRVLPWAQFPSSAVCFRIGQQ